MARRKDEHSTECLTQTRAETHTSSDARRSDRYFYAGTLNVTPRARDGGGEGVGKARRRRRRITRDLPNTPSDILPRAA